MCGYLVAVEARRRVEHGDMVHRCAGCGTRLATEPLPPPHKQSAGELVVVKCYNCNQENDLRVGVGRRGQREQQAGGQ